MQDPISDMFIRLKNAQRAEHDMVRLSYSKFKHEIAKALERAGMVGAVERKGKRVKKTLEIQLVSREGKPAITDVKLLSTPSRRVYATLKELRAQKRGGVIIVSTPKGVMSVKEARKERVGGALIAEIW